MQKEEGEKLKEEVENLLHAACIYQERGNIAREVCREHYRRIETNDENILRILIDGLIGLLAERLTGKIVSTSETTAYQLGLSTSFIRTHYIICDFILNGDLVEAVILTRKQFESLARLHELESQPWQKLAGKVPNIKKILKGSGGRIYGDLSEVAHFSTPRVMELLSIVDRGELIGPSLLPRYSKMSSACFDMNCIAALYFIIWLVEKLQVWYPSCNLSEEQRLVEKTVVLALRVGVIRPAESNGNCT